MTRIDFSRIITSKTRETAHRAQRRQDIRADCGRRIRAILDETAQLNIQGAVLSGTLSADEIQVFRAAQTWIGAMRDACRHGIAEGVAPDWPDLPNGVADLARRF